ncbi:hypothetical protein, partial [Oceanospirillum multiglobuliferum]
TSSKHETESSALPELPLYVDAFTKLSEDNDQLDPSGEVELEEETAKYHDEDSPPPPLLTMNSSSG